MPSLTPWRCVPPGQSLSHLAALSCNVRHFVVLRCPCPLDDGGEGMAIAIGVYRVSPPLIRSQPRAGQRPLFGSSVNRSGNPPPSSARRKPFAHLRGFFHTTNAT